MRVPLDPGLYPLIRHIESDAQYRVWLACRAWDTRGAGYVDLSTIDDILAANGVVYSERHQRRILTAGAGLFWTIQNDRLWLASAAKLWERLTMMLPTELTRWVRPSKLKPCIDLSGDLQTFQARCYAVWIAGNTKRHWHGFKVSRAQISYLMQVSRPTLYTWEALAGIEITRSEAQYAGRDTRLIPDHANLYTAEIAPGEYETRAYWRLPNTYTSAAYMGEARAARRADRRARNTAIEAVMGDSPINNADGERLRRYFNRGDVDTTFKAMQRAARRADVPGTPSGMLPTDAPRFAFIGYRRDGVEVWELPTQLIAPETTANERSTTAEKSPAFYRLWGAFKDAMKDGFTAISCVGHRFTGYERLYPRIRESVRPLAQLTAFVASVGGSIGTARPTAATPHQRQTQPTVTRSAQRRRGSTARPPAPNIAAKIAGVYHRLDNALAAGLLTLAGYVGLRDYMSDATDESERYDRAAGVALELEYAG